MQVRESWFELAEDAFSPLETAYGKWNDLHFILEAGSYRLEALKRLQRQHQLARNAYDRAMRIYQQRLADWRKERAKHAPENEKEKAAFDRVAGWNPNMRPLRPPDPPRNYMTEAELYVREGGGNVSWVLFLFFFPSHRIIFFLSSLFTSEME